MVEKVTNRPDVVKDGNAIISVDTSGLEAYKKRKARNRQFDALIERLADLERRVTELESK